MTRPSPDELLGEAARLAYHFHWPLDTILDLGLNDATMAGLAEATGDAAFASACRDRLGVMFRDIVGVDAVPEDPWQQLRLAVEAVFRSWHSERAIAYRRREGIPDDLGTAVTVQTRPPNQTRWPSASTSASSSSSTASTKLRRSRSS